MRHPPWNDTENRALIALYFAMLNMATNRQPYNKALMIRCSQHGCRPENRASYGGFAHALVNRSRGSIEAKLMNASAAHLAIDPQAETMASHGYKAWGNYQASLKQAMADEIGRCKGREACAPNKCFQCPADAVYKAHGLYMCEACAAECA